MRLVPWGEKIAVRLLVLYLCGWMAAPLSLSNAQVAPKAVNTRIVETTRLPHDLGTKTAQITEPTTNVVTTNITGGSRPGGGTNLFHSFDFFTVGSKDVAHFLNDHGLPTTNIIARVIGDAAGIREASTIDGILRTNHPLNLNDPLNFGGANLYLVNPAGIIFGKDAQLDIKGSFAASTANYLRMTDNALFHTDMTAPVLSVGSVEAFGFTVPKPVGITLDQSGVVVTAGKDLTVVGGDVLLRGGFLFAPSGAIKVAAVASTGEVIANSPGTPAALTLQSFTDLGRVDLQSAPSGLPSAIVTNGDGAGTVVIRAGDLAVSNSSVILAESTGASDGAALAIDLQTTRSLTVTNGAAIQSVAVQQGDAGDITVASPNIAINNRSYIASFTVGAGDTGDVTVQGQNIAMASRGQIDIDTSSAGNAGRLTVQADTISMTNAGGTGGAFTSIVNQALPGSTGRGGDLAVTARVLDLRNGAQISTTAAGQGQGGSLTVQADALTVTGVDLARFPAGLFATAFSTGTGNAGNMSITAESVDVSNGGQISTSTFGSGRGGNLDITADTITLRTHNPVAATGLFARGAVGAGGTATIRARTLDILDGAGITASTRSSGRSGNIDIEAERVTLAGVGVSSRRASITNQSDFGATGAGGDINIRAESVEVRNGAQIAVAALGPGNGGALVIDADRVLVSGVQGGLTARLNASTQTTGSAGTIDIAAGTVEVTNGGQIAARSLVSTGDGGRITISADDVTVSGRDPSFAFPSRITAATEQGSRGRGGDIQIAAGTLTVNNGADVSVTTASPGPGGNLIVTADTIRLDGGLNPAVQAETGLSAQSNSSGSAGSIIVNSGNVTITNGADISASAVGSGGAGNILINSETVDLTKGGAINSVTTGSGRGGTIELNATEVNVMSGGEISAASSASGAAGSITVNADDVTIVGIAGSSDPLFADFTGMSVRTVNGPGGTITVDSDNLTVGDLGVITSATSGSGNAGAINLEAAKSLALTRGGLISATTSGSGTGGSISITSDTVSVDSQARILASASSAGGAGSIFVSANHLAILNGSQISSNSTGTQATAGSAGNITIRGFEGDGTQAQSLLVSGNDSLVSTDTDGRGQGGNIKITTDHMQIEHLGKITAETSGKGKAGNVTLDGDTLTIMSGGRIEASTSGEGAGGAIDVTMTGDVTVAGVSGDGQTRSGIFAKTQSPSGTGGGSGGGGSGGGGGGSGGGSGSVPKPGNAGNIDIMARNLWLNRGAQIDSSTTSGGTGGNVSVTALGNLTIAGSGTRLTSDATRGDGAGGGITLVAQNMTVEEGATVTAATGGKGDAGNIALTAQDQLVLRSAGTVTTSTRGSGKGGTITIKAKHVLLDGAGTAVTADTLRPFADLTITINILHPNDGDLVVQLDSPVGTRMALLSRVGGTGDNFINTSFNDQAATAITGSAPFTGTFKPREPLAQLIDELAGGNWTLNVRDQAAGNVGSLESWTLQIGSQTFQSTGGSQAIPDNGTLRSTIAVANLIAGNVPGAGEASGAGGDVTVTAETVTVQNGATLSATTRGSGKGGTLTVHATGPVALAGAKSGLFTDSEASGTGGDINVTASRMTVDSGATLSAKSSATGDAGTIMIDAGSEFLSTNGSVTTESRQASGGNIALFATDMIRMRDSTISASVFGGPQTAGGNIFIDPQFILLQNSRVVAQAVQGAGGNINLAFSRAFLADARSTISASSQFGVSGTVQFNSPVQNLSGALVPLKQSFLSGDVLLNQRCAARAAGGGLSSFIITDNEGLPPAPGGVLSSPVFWEEEPTPIFGGGPGSLPVAFGSASGGGSLMAASPLLMSGQGCR